jgi:arylsulfatase A
VRSIGHRKRTGRERRRGDSRPWAGRSVILLAALAVIAGVVWGCTGSSEPSRPNIVLVIGDDHAYTHSGFMGDPIASTPNLDRLAAGGVVFTTAYATASTCEPSLRSLVTGTEPFPRGPGSPSQGEMNPATTLPGLLGRAGYASFQVGKFWMGSFARAGFTEGTKGDKLEGGSFEKFMGGRRGLEVGRTTMKPVFDFIDRNENTPFFLFYAPNLPHRPWNAPDKYRSRYAAVAKQLGPVTLSYYANISWFDDGLGQLMDYVDAKGLRSRTLFVYLSDNGFRQDPGTVFAPDKLDHAKDSMADLGFRTPLVFNWPGKVPAGVVRDDLVSLLDLFPTLLDFAGVPIPEGRPGIDLRAAIEQGTPVPRTELIGAIQRVRPVTVGGPPKPNTRRAYFLRSPRWHYALYPETKTEQLFDLQADPREQNDVAVAHPTEVDEFKKRIERWIAEDPASGG